jgi:hypothetical protein
LIAPTIILPIRYGGDLTHRLNNDTAVTYVGTAATPVEMTVILYRDTLPDSAVNYFAVVPNQYPLLL